MSADQPQSDPVACIVCHAGNTEVAVHIPQVPVLCNILWPTRSEALQVPKVDVDLAFCHTCGHLFNPDFDPSLMIYSQEYENSLHFSARFQRFADQLAGELIERYRLHQKDIIELGCGKGDFLKLLCSKGDNRGVGFDKSYVPDVKTTLPDERVSFVQDWYSDKYAECPADFMVCRHVLEHVEDPFAYLTELRHIIGERNDLTLYFEVPNALHTLQGLAIWDIIYEHCSYFSKYSLEHLFVSCGFEVVDVYEGFEGQFLGIEARPVRQPLVPALDPSEILADLRSFAQRYSAKTRSDKVTLLKIKEVNQKAVIWGAGSKGITFLNMLKLQDQIQYAIDINPRKQGKFITGAGQEIVNPEYMREYKPDVIIVMNSIYMDEIRSKMANLGVDARYLHL